MSDQQHPEQPLKGPDSVGTFVLHLRAGTGESIVGSVGPATDEPPIPFNGWLGFIAAINTLRARMDSASGEGSGQPDDKEESRG